ncbi:hypothetical protein Bca52824_001957 [Brassica carinata]|uniref:Uncharacterized protein n=1 Tax=Brassica carinata TaxID=52824 RepID=A0A8X8BEE1_BRACI|nr:hypothetical protein Bca52824_001957 [Brassica carinata]
MAVPVVDLLNNSDSSSDEDFSDSEFPEHQCRSRFYSRVYYVFERAKLIGYDKAKELDERGKALFLKDLEACKEMCELIASAITAMKSVK